MFDIPSSSSSFDTYGVDKWNDVCARKRRGTSLAASVDLLFPVCHFAHPDRTTMGRRKVLFGLRRVSRLWRRRLFKFRPYLRPAREHRSRGNKDDYRLSLPRKKTNKWVFKNTKNPKDAGVVSSEE